jgi:hypothetical protein
MVDINSIKGTAPSGSEIYIYSDDYFPYNDSGFTDSTTPGNTGVYHFLNLEPGIYNILCKYQTGDTSVFAQQISVQAQDHPDTDTVMLTITGTIKGVLIDTLDKPVNGAYAYIKGSPYYTATNNLGEYLLTKIPDGRYTLEFITTNRNSWVKEPPVTVSVTVTAGKSTEMKPVIYK